MAKRRNEWFDWVKALIIALGLAFIIRIFFFSPIFVDGPSMLPTLHHGDQIIINKFIYRVSKPERFDIVVFHATDQKDFIKRVIGLPGEHIMIKNNQLYVNGNLVEEPFLTDYKGAHDIVTEDFSLELLPGSYDKIPDGYVLLLGDNRNNSTDSRSLGLIRIDEIVGKANLIYWPLDRIQWVPGT